MVYEKLRCSKKPFENAERYRYKTLFGKDRDIYCSGEPIAESTTDLVCDLIAPAVCVIVSIAVGTIKLRKAGISSADAFHTLFAELMPLTAVGGLVILILAGCVFSRIRRFIISRRKYVKVLNIEGENACEKYQSL